MRFKNLGVLFLLSLASIYFICPVQCAAIREAVADPAVDKVMGHQQHQAETNQSTCCQSENQPSPSHEPQEEEQGHCCLNQWELFGASEPQIVSQIQKDTFSLIALNPIPPRISSDPVFFITYLQLSCNRYTDSSIPQCCPRAPPFSLA